MKKPFIKTALLSFAAAALLAGCATPHVVQEKKVTDNELSCKELVKEIAKAEDFEEEARDEKGATGTNVAAVIFFPIGILATYMNVDEAIKAAQDRIEHLQDIYEEKGC